MDRRDTESAPHDAPTDDAPLLIPPQDTDRWRSLPVHEEGPDLVGWLSLAVILPGVCYGAPLVFVVNVVRAVWRARQGREVRGPTALAILLSGVVSAFWLWFFWRMSNGAVP